MKLAHVIEELVEERGLDRETIARIVAEGILAAYGKKYPTVEFDVAYDKKNDEVAITAAKTVVSSVEDDLSQISLRKARSFKKDAQIGDILWLPFEGTIGRIEILKAKQIIAQKIRTVEYELVYNEFKPKEGAIVHGVIHRCERNGMRIKIQDAFAFLPRSLTIPGDKCIVGYAIRALLKEVLSEPRNENQLILDRTSPQFLKSLFELEIPEVFERLVEVKKVVRIPGYKAKVVVASNDANIDPVGTCVGVGGARIKPILRELGTEKIDIIAETDSPEEMVRSALKPAKINRIMIQNKKAHVWVDDDQRSVAIGKMGQNIALACELTDMHIELVREEGSAVEQEQESEEDQMHDKLL